MSVAESSYRPVAQPAVGSAMITVAGMAGDGELQQRNDAHICGMGKFQFS